MLMQVWRLVVIRASTKVTHRCPEAHHKLKVDHQRVSTEHFANIFISKKPAVFFPAGINLFKANKVEHCINILTGYTKETFAS